MNVVILIVRTLDWKNIDSFPWPCCKERRWKRFVGRVEHWNKNFNINYFSYRARLKEISLKSFEATGIPVVECAHYGEATEFLNENMDKNLIVLPTDDDDWYHPDIKSHLEPFFQDETLPILQWQGWIYNCKHTEAFHKHESTKYVGSNEYAIRCEETEGEIKDHADIPKNYFKTTEPLSVWVRHLGSLWDNQLGGFRLNPELKLSPIPDEIEWATDYIEMLRSIDLKKVRHKP